MTADDEAPEHRCHGYRRYDEQGTVPLAGYATLATAFAAATGTLTVLARRRGVTLPERVPPWDVLLLGVATYKTARLLTKAKITGFLRAPVTRRVEDAKAGEVMDEPLGGNAVKQAVGELVTCPFCASTWSATGLVGAYVLAPRGARLVGAALSAMTLADWLQYAWTWTQENAEG
ncbi:MULTISPECIES: DUF1360 domain-containing protein [unclassified Streptomyces]|uniref:DUF1360 domain-containing protein n=1 Tax=unclassified Streptomyces TaxID=2593676 RepID=UPI001CBFE66B|nr:MULTISPECIES: DUF1360 domain-containing protein [unclassified Streptomyces]WPO70514.1 DUF1360 domain-containing protein [Streptomyces sp. KN37]